MNLGSGFAKKVHQILNRCDELHYQIDNLAKDLEDIKGKLENSCSSDKIELDRIHYDKLKSIFELRLELASQREKRRHLETDGWAIRVFVNVNRRHH